MKFLTACYWQQGVNTASLLLQQYVCEGVSVLFACVCQGKTGDDKSGGYMTEQLLQWFRGVSLKRLARRPEAVMDSMETELKKLIARTDRELKAVQLKAVQLKAVQLKAIQPKTVGAAEAVQDTALSGILCVGDSFCLFYRGEQRVYMVNTGFGRSHIKRLDTDCGGLVTERGSLQPAVGLLFAVEPFYERLSEQIIREGLFVGEVQTQAQLEKHLKELGAEAERQGGSDMAAVFVRTDEEEVL